jgi:fusaric acid resistance family protein
MTVVRIQAIARPVSEACARAARRIADDAWPLLQGTAAAVTAWVLAKYVLDHPDPIFAPIAALVALNTALGERGLNALRLLQGVFLGIIVGEATLAILDGGYGSMALAILVATAAARALGGTRIVIAQAAVGAILTVGRADPEVGVERLTDALVGAGVAIVFSQLLFSPEPVALLRRGERAVLENIAAGLTLTASALEHDDDQLAERAIERLRDLPDEVTELRRLGRATFGVARRTVWRSQRTVVVRENENADQLDLVGGSCLFLARLAPSLRPPERRVVAHSVRALADVVTSLATHLGDVEVRQRAADRALDVATSVRADNPGRELALVIAAVRALATDLIVFAGVDLDDAVAAVRKGILKEQVREPAPVAPKRFGWLRRLVQRASPD